MPRRHQRSVASRQTSLSLPEDLVAYLRTEAEAANVSLSLLIVRGLERGLDGVDAARDLVSEEAAR